MLMSEEVLIKYKKYLTDLEYPFIKEKADYEIHNIFNSEYREFLLSWIITKFIPAYNNKLEESKKNNKLDQVLANIIYENGFCRASEKDAFVKGNLDINSQIVIFDRIFHMLSLTYRNNFSSTDETKENMPQTENYFKQIFMKPSVENFKNNILQDVTLIPTLGVSSKISENEKKKKIQFYRDEIEKLQEILDKIELNDGESGNGSNSSIDSSNITEKLDKLTSKFINCTNQFKIDDFITVTENNEENTLNQLNLEDCVENNAQILNVLLKTIQKKCDLNEIMSEKVFDQDEDLIHGNDYFACVLQNYAMSDNILQEINRNAED